MPNAYDAGVVGAGIIGLAHAYHLARRGMRVIVFERNQRAQGASVRNFGMIWPIGQSLGPMYQLARRSREIWREILQESGLWHRQCGSLHLAYHEDEAQVLREFVAESTGIDRVVETWTPGQICSRFPAVAPSGLRAGLWSASELAVDPRQVIAKFPDWLTRTYGVEFAFGTAVLGRDSQRVLSADGERHVHRLVICTGTDFRELAPKAFADSGLIPCKLQMMRSQAFGDRVQLGTHLAAGLTLRHYASFAKCPTLPALVRRFDAEMPDYGQYGIHVLVSQNGRGELTIGDSHEYGDAIEPFDKPYVDDLILAYFRTFVNIPDLAIAERWHGIYVKHPTLPFVVAHIDPETIAVTGVGGAGMTLSFGLAEKVVNDWLGGTS
jgi:FAD dependent oxidoreductase TIGR03364